MSFNFNKLFYVRPIADCKGKKLYLKLNILGINHSFYIGELVEFFWINRFKKYFKSNNMKNKIKCLKQGMDEISCEYIDNFMKLVPYWNSYKKEIWTKYDIVTENRTDEFLKSFNQPFPDILQINQYMMANIYGLIDLPKGILNNINGKIIVDGGGLNGDTALMFHYYFPKSEVHVFEPLSININKIYSFLETDNCNNKIIPVKKGLGKKKDFIEIRYNDTEMAEIISLDEYFSEKFDKSVGLIKLDTEGFETSIINGALNIIKRDKPILAIAMYHTPEDFFDLKSKIEKLDLGYKFMIRRSEKILPQADLVLIAY